MDPKIYETMREVEDRHWWFVGRRRIVRETIAGLALPRSAEILDAGCGTGGNLEMLREFGEVTGLEYDPRALQLARDRALGDIHPGSLPGGLPDLNKSFDLIVLLDVLEHIDDDLGSVRALGELLKPGGYLCVTVPAFPVLFGQHDIQHHHKRRYVSGTLSRVIRDVGLSVVRDSYFNTVLFPAVAAVRLAERLVKPNDVSGELRVPGKWTNKVLTNLFASERFAMQWFPLPFGVSLIMVAQRPESSK